ncbi:MAG TPA: methyltransferase domain-containing protein [Kiloniellaceae bacterium]|nr:methyltransferase domain-containing protein [Kiloniellaceae bacterium]
MNATATQEQLEAGRGYEALFVAAAFDKWTKHVIDGAGVTLGERVLDIGCGTGVLTRHALRQVGPAGHVAGLDPAPGMIAAAQEIEPDIEWTLGGAEEIPFDDEAFDCVISQFSMMFFSDCDAAAREFYRVLAPGGRLAVAVWNSVEHSGAYGDIIAVLDEQVSTAAGDALRLPYTLGDAQAVVRTFSDAGFSDATFETRVENACFPSSRTMVEAELRGWLPLFGIHLSEDKIADVLVRSDERLSKYASASGEAVFPTCGHIVTARKPL